MEERLAKLYESKKMLEELGIPISQEQLAEIKIVEQKIIEEKLFPMLEDLIKEKTKGLQGELHLEIHKNNQGLVEVKHITGPVNGELNPKRKTTYISRSHVVPKIKRGKEEITFADDSKYIPTVKELVDLVKRAAEAGDTEKINGGVAIATTFNVTYDNSKVTPANGGKKYNRRTVICSDEEVRLDGIYRRALGFSSFSEWLTGTKRGYIFKQ